jgi:hypothetical protein
VNDITIISNERSELEKELLIYNTKTKLYIDKRVENLFVNESWNYGVKLADNDNIAILNDDILIDTEVFSFLHDKLTDVGIVGMCFENYALKQSVSMNLTDVVERPYGYGCAMFIHKPNYVNIPEELKIACGDDYLIKFAKGKAKKLFGCKIESDIATTTRLPEFGLIQLEDNRIYNENYKNKSVSNVSKWDNWYKELGNEPSSYKYSETESYKIAANFLKELDVVEDWGVGGGGFLNHLPSAIGVDGSDTPFAHKKFIDLCNYVSKVNGVHLRHVLEHNYEWKQVLKNALTSAKDKLVITFFIPFSDGQTKELAHNLIYGVDVPDLSISKKEFDSILQSFSTKKIEIISLENGTAYGIEIIYKITMQ